MSKIIFIASQRLPTEKAYGIQITKMCEAFSGIGESVELLIPKRNNNTTEDIFQYYGVDPSFKVSTISAPDFYFPGFLDRVAFLIKQRISSTRLVKVALSRGADVIYSRDELPIHTASLYKNHPQLVFEAHRFSSRRYWFYERFNRAGVKIVAISQGIKDEFVRFGYEPNNIIVAHDGADLEEFENLADKITIRRELNLPQDKKIVMYIGQLFDWKGVDTLVKTSEFLDTNILIFIGGGSDKEIAKLKGLDHTNSVRFEGSTPFRLLPQYLKAADILVLPNKKDGDISEFYTSPLKLFAYMASGQPIIASDLPSLREILNDTNSILVKADDPEAFADGIKRLITDSSLAASLGHQAFLDVQNRTWVNRARVIAALWNKNNPHVS